jgi:hypothetical protein
MPRIHLPSQESLSFLMDGRVKPGHDETVVPRYNGADNNKPLGERQCSSGFRRKRSQI